MATWMPGPAGVRMRTAGGTSTIASCVAAVFTIGVTALTFLIAAAMLLPAPGGPGVRIGEVASPSPSASPAVPSGSAAPRASRPPGDALTAAPSAAVTAPPPSRAPTLARIRASVPLIIDGRVTVRGLRAATKPGAEVEPGERVLVVTVRLSARARLPYDADHWQLEDETGERWNPLPDSPANHLGAGTLARSRTRTGTVAFVVPRDRAVRSAVLTDGDGTDLVVFDRPPPSNRHAGPPASPRVLR